MKAFIVISLFSLLFQNEEQRVLQKIYEMGNAGRKNLSVKKITNSFKIVSDIDTESKYMLHLNNEDVIYFSKYDGDKADAFSLHGKRYVVSEHMNDLMFKWFNPRFLSLESMNIYEIGLKNRKYIVVIAETQSAAGKAVNYSLYFIFDITDKKNIKYTPAASYYGDIRNITDIDNDGTLDFLKGTVVNDRSIAVEAYNIFPPAKKNLIKKQIVSLK